MTIAARAAVRRFTDSHGTRRETDRRHGVKTLSSPLMPTMRCMSSVASSWMMPMAWLASTWPTRRPSASTTGMAM